jgi:sensor histidine kinase YesM
MANSGVGITQRARRMDALYHVDWPALIAGTLLGLITAIIAKLLHGKILTLLERTKVIRASTRRNSEIKRYLQLKSFHTGKTNIYLHAFAWQLLLMCLFFLATVLGIGAVVHYMLYIINFPGQSLAPEYSVLVIFCTILVLVSVIVCVLASFRLIGDYRLLMDFESYEAQLKNRYPDAFPPNP